MQAETYDGPSEAQVNDWNIHNDHADGAPSDEEGVEELLLLGPSTDEDVNVRAWLGEAYRQYGAGRPLRAQAAASIGSLHAWMAGDGPAPSVDEPTDVIPPVKADPLTMPLPVQDLRNEIRALITGVCNHGIEIGRYLGTMDGPTADDEYVRLSNNEQAQRHAAYDKLDQLIGLLRGEQS